MRAQQGWWLRAVWTIFLCMGRIAHAQIPGGHPAGDALPPIQQKMAAADYRAADSLLKAAFCDPRIGDDERLEHAWTWARELLLSARFRESIALLGHCQSRYRAQISRSPQHFAALAECYMDLATEVQLAGPRDQALAMGALAFARLPQGAPRRSAIARKLSVLSRLLQDTPAAIAWADSAWANLDGRPDDTLRLCLEEATLATRLGLPERNTAMLAHAEAIVQRMPHPAQEDIVQFKLLRAESLDRMADASDTPFELLEASKQSLLELKAVGDAHPQLMSHHYFMGLRRLSENLERLGDIEGALPYAQQALAGHLKRGTAPKTIALSYEALGSKCHYFGRIDEALRYYELAMRYTPHDTRDPRDSDEASYAVSLANYGQELITSERYAEGERYSFEALERLQRLRPPRLRYQAQIHLNLAVGYDMQLCPEEAAHHYRQCASLAEATGNIQSAAQARIGSAVQLLHLDSLAAAEGQVRLGVKAIGDLPAELPLSRLFPLMDLAEYHLQARHLPEALAVNHQLLRLVLYDYRADDMLACPDLQNFLSPVHTLEAVDQKMRILWELYRAGGSRDHLSAMLEWGMKALALLRQVRQSRVDEGEQLADNAHWRKLFEHALQAAMELHRVTADDAYLHAAFEVAEQSKAMLLLEAIVQNRVLETSGGTADVADRMRRLRGRMHILRQQIGNNADPATRVQQHEALLALQAQYDTLQQSAGRANGKYFDLVYGFDIVRIPQLQASLRAGDRALVEYFYGDSIIYTFVVNPDTFAVRAFTYGTAFQDSLQRLLAHLHRSPADGDPDAARVYLGYSDAVRRALWQPVAGLLREQVTVVPDGPLSYLSFDALVDGSAAADKPRFQDFRYLVERHVLSYSYSATFMTAPRRESRATPLSILGIAPVFEEGSGLRPLPMAMSAMEGLQAQFADVQVLGGPDATKQRFLELAPRARILDLATHGKFDRKDFLDSRIYFSPSGRGDSLLHLRDLYSLDLPAELAILQACETGLGDYREGEGVMSLARGFTYAGCHSVLMSLWNVPEDPDTKSIVSQFYQQLADGVPRDRAITVSKRQFLQTAREESGHHLLKIHPYYWSQLVMVGENGPLPLQRIEGATATSWLLAGVVGILVIALVACVWFAWRRKARRDSPSPR